MRNDAVTTSCPTCGSPFPPPGGAATAQTRAAKQPTVAATPPVTEPPRRPDTSVYECGSCGQRSLGQQRCPDCNLFSTRLGPGGPCPHCDEPVTYEDLTQGGLT